MSTTDFKKECKSTIGIHLRFWVKTDSDLFATIEKQLGECGVCDLRTVMPLSGRIHCFFGEATQAVRDLVGKKEYVKNVYSTTR